MSERKDELVEKIVEEVKKKKISCKSLILEFLTTRTGLTVVMVKS